MRRTGDHWAARRGLRRFSAFLGNQDGAITIFAIIAFVMLLGFIGLVMDVGRVMNIHSQANSYADRVALAAAAELDGRPGALERARRAASDPALRLVEIGNRFTLSGDASVDVRKLTFMSEIGPDDADPYARSPFDSDVVTATWEPGGAIAYAAGWDATSATRETTFVLVDVTRETEDYIFFPIIVAFAPGIDVSATVAPQALAGFRRTLCNYPPVFMCNIAEAAGGPGAPFDPQRGQQILAKAGGSGGGWGPGNFGLIDAPEGHGASSVREYMANVNPNTQCTSDTVLTKPGASTGPVAQGMNVRMDMYDGPMSGNKNNASYAPAPNVLKGIKAGGGGCPSNNPSTTSTPFPRDNCFMPTGAWPDPEGGIPSGAGTGCTNYGGIARAGDGNWARADYWAYNHGTAWPPAGLSANATRYDVYRHEIATPDLVDTADEEGGPTCSSAPTTTDPAYDRRVLPIAVVNCLEAAANGNPIQGSTDVLAEVVGYLDVFLTEPVGNSDWWCPGGAGSCNQDLYVEVISFVRANTAESVLREYPVLYR